MIMELMGKDEQKNNEIRTSGVPVQSSRAQPNHTPLSELSQIDDNNKEAHRLVGWLSPGCERPGES